jgi:hypothetical protein
VIRRLPILASTGTCRQKPRGFARVDPERLAIDIASYRKLDLCLRVPVKALALAKVATGAALDLSMADAGREPD